MSIISEARSEKNIPRAPGIRERRQALKAEIMGAAERLLETHDVSELTVDAVMAGTELARTNFFRFGNSELVGQPGSARLNRHDYG